MQQASGPPTTWPITHARSGSRRGITSHQGAHTRTILAERGEKMKGKPMPMHDKKMDKKMEDMKKKPMPMKGGKKGC